MAMIVSLEWMQMHMRLLANWQVSGGRSWHSHCGYWLRKPRCVGCVLIYMCVKRVEWVGVWSVLFGCGREGPWI